jgi:hypothetical protein
MIKATSMLAAGTGHPATQLITLGQGPLLLLWK